MLMGFGHYCRGATGVVSEGLELLLGICLHAHISHRGPAPLFSLQHSELGVRFAVTEERLQFSLTLHR